MSNLRRLGMQTVLEIEVRRPIDYLDVLRIDSHIRKIVRAADDPRVVAFPLKARRPWRRALQSSGR
jgi:hypothetical protein